MIKIYQTWSKYSIDLMRNLGNINTIVTIDLV